MHIKLETSYFVEAQLYGRQTPKESRASGPASSVYLPKMTRERVAASLRHTSLYHSSLLPFVWTADSFRPVAH